MLTLSQWQQWAAEDLFNLEDPPMKQIEIILIYDVPEDTPESSLDSLLSDLEEVVAKAPYNFDLNDSSWDWTDF